jgi:type I restriction enzyme S subunit
MVVAQPVTPEWFGFVLGVMSSVDFVAHTDRGSAGTKMPRTNWTDMAAYRVAKPPVALAARFTTLIQPLVDRIIAGIHENRTLSAVRDTLLPKLISGEVVVPEALGRAD